MGRPNSRPWRAARKPSAKGGGARRNVWAPLSISNFAARSNGATLAQSKASWHRGCLPRIAGPHIGINYAMICFALGESPVRRHMIKYNMPGLRLQPILPGLPVFWPSSHAISERNEVHSASPDVRLSHCPRKVAVTAAVTERRPVGQPQVEGSPRHRARLRPVAGVHNPGCAQHRAGAADGEDRPRPSKPGPIMISQILHRATPQRQTTSDSENSTAKPLSKSQKKKTPGAEYKND